MIRLQQAVNDMKFLSTLSLRRATGGYGCAYLYLIISIHALLAESDGMTEFIGALFDISIHALLAESDLPVFLSGFWAYLFLSTLSLRRATAGAVGCQSHGDISIHALLAESDGMFSRLITAFTHFYPRSPCGERREYEYERDAKTGHFYPRSPCGERPAIDKWDKNGFYNFYPRSPCGERRSAWVQEFPELYISIHALLAESDRLAPRP